MTTAQHKAPEPQETGTTDGGESAGTPLLHDPVLSVHTDRIPAEISALRQWVLWRLERPNDKWTKVPYQVGGRKAASTRSETWNTFAAVVAEYELGKWDGIGFVLSPTENEDGMVIVAVDLDHCREPEGGSLDPWATEIIDALDSYSEVSPSGTGVRILLWGRLPDHGRKNGAFEVYCADRYVTITGHHLKGTPATLEPRPEALLAIHQKVFGDGQKKASKEKAKAAAPVHSEDDAEVVRRASEAKNGEKFKRLMAGDCGGYKSHSEADAALCEMLLWWCRGDRDQADRLFRASGLYRDKWDERRGARTYGEMTFDFAEEKCGGKNYEPPGRGPRLVGIFANGTNGKHAENGAEPPPPNSAKSAHGDEKPPTGYEIIKRHFAEKYRPAFRRNLILYSDALGRDVKHTEACWAPSKDLVDQLAVAQDVPTVPKSNTPDRNAVAGSFFRTWANVAWVDLLGSLPDEQNVAEVIGTAEEEFRDRVAAALWSHASLGNTYHDKDGSDRTQTERRTLIQWCQLFSKPSRWGDIRGYQLWCRKSPHGELQVALRKGLFDQIAGGAVLSRLTSTKFTQLAQQYGVGTGDTVKGSRAMILAPAFLAHLLDRPAESDGLAEDPSPASAREEQVSK